MDNFSPVPIHLQFTPGYNESAEGTPAFLYTEDIPPKLKNATFRRDGNVCQSCGFYAEKHQNTLPIEGRTRDLDDLITLCNFCHQCFRIDQVSIMRSGVLVYLPEIAQADLHHVARDAYRARITQNEYAGAAQGWLNLITNMSNPENRREAAIQRIGTDDPYQLTAKLKNARSPQKLTDLQEALKGIRLLPLDRHIAKEEDLEFNKFPQILAFWRSKAGPYANSLEFPWLVCAIEALGGTPPEVESSRSTFLTAEVAPNSLKVAVSLRLLQKVIDTFETLIKTYPDIAGSLQERIHIFLKLGEAFAVNPAGMPDADLEERLNIMRSSELKQSIKHWVGTGLGDSAQYFDALFASNVQFPQSIPRNTEQYKLLCRLLMS
ncbi:MAG: hypothetical protein GY938_10530 [Ketobacter sp.]|nr:hypothetical protein [Ketobacter sp.]